MDDKIKTKAQEVRLALLEALSRELTWSDGCRERLTHIEDVTSILNAIEPGPSIGSYASSVVPLTDEEIRSMKSA